MSLNLDVIRQQFSSLNRPAIFFNNPAGLKLQNKASTALQTI